MTKTRTRTRTMTVTMTTPILTPVLSNNDGDDGSDYENNVYEINDI